MEMEIEIEMEKKKKKMMMIKKKRTVKSVRSAFGALHTPRKYLYVACRHIRAVFSFII